MGVKPHGFSGPGEALPLHVYAALRNSRHKERAMAKKTRNFDEMPSFWGLEQAA